MSNPIEQHRPDEWALYNPLHGKTMLELGGKWCSQAAETYKSVFEGLGYRHVSIDWNGEHGAIKRDLRKPLWDEFGQFDMVSNIGTTEHVDGPGAQAAVWENIHRMTKVGGVYVGLTPYHDGRSWWWHGDWYPTEKFYETFAKLNGWEIERLYADREEPFKNLMCRMRKVEEVEQVSIPLSHIVRNHRRSRHNVPTGCVNPSA